MQTKAHLIAVFLAIVLVLAGITGFVCSATGSKQSPAGTPPSGSPSEPDSTGPKIYLIKIDAPITPVVSEYIVRSIDKAARDGEALIIQLDTPGGLVDSMREIVKRMLSSEVPIVVYVAPRGARAASAGTFITLAANIAAMAPNTSMGSAHPVTMQGKMDKTMEDKVVNHLAATIRGIAEKRGRNVKWAEDAVRKSVDATETEALKVHIIDIVAPDIPTLVKDIDGKTVDLAMGKKTLNTRNAQIKEIEMGFRYKILEIISNPNIAYILLMLGFFGLYFELANPGSVLPGVAGAICLILGFYALHTLPINYAGLLLIILGIGLLIAEAFVTSHGVLGVGGTIAMFLGSIMLIDSASPFLRISWSVIIPAVILSAILFAITVTIAVRVHREKADTGKEGMIGMHGEAKTDILKNGQVLVRGEYWNAWSDTPVAKGDRVTVVGIDGLRLKVNKAD